MSMAADEAEEYLDYAGSIVPTGTVRRLIDDVRELEEVRGKTKQERLDDWMQTLLLIRHVNSDNAGIDLEGTMVDALRCMRRVDAEVKKDG